MKEKEMVQIAFTEAQAVFVGHAVGMAIELTIHGDTDTANEFAELIRQLLVAGIFTREECNNLQNNMTAMFAHIMKTRIEVEKDR